jgi:tetraacyldisaccharide 4'-kinase
LAWLLLPLAVLFRLATWAHRAWYTWGLGTVQHAPVPLIVVGNVVAGGVGKTPVVMALVEHLKQRGLSVGIVSRGHGRQDDKPQLVVDESHPDDVGDEPLLLFRRCAVPVAVARQRIDAVQLLVHAHPGVQVIVSDDGLQHHAMRHDMAICVFDDRGIGNGWPLPAGPLRETWPRQPAQGSQQWVLNTGNVPQLEGYQASRHLALQARNGLGETRPLSDWAGKPIGAMAGIAHPERYFDMLRQRGLSISAALSLTDHADTTTLERAWEQLREQQDVLCTEKDAVKLWRRHPQVWAVPLLTDLPPELLARIDAVLAAKLSSPHGHQTA